MRVALDCRMALWTGVGRYTVGLARALNHRDDIDLVAVVGAGSDMPQAFSDVSCVEAAGHPFSFTGARSLARAVRDIRPDVVHCPHFPTPSPVEFPLVVTMHDLTPLLIPGVMPSVFKRAVYRWQTRRAVNVADRIITLSAFSLGEVERVYPAARGKGRVVFAAADDFASGPLEPLGGPLAEFTSAPYVLSMGSVRPHKDLPTLLSAFARIAAARPEVRLLLVGAEQPGYVVQHLGSAPVGLRDRVAFTGPVSDGVLRSLYASAAAFAFPSRYEGFGLPPLEAMAMGAPVVVARAASLPEVVGDAALTFAAGESDELAVCLERLLDDAPLRARLVAAGRARAGELTWDRTAATTTTVYSEVLGT